METITCSIQIKANKEKVWKTMLEKNTYEEWSKAFHVGSTFKGSWDKGSEIRFIAADENGKESGMFSRIKENIPYKFISIEHLGEIKDGIVDTTSEQVKKWSPSFENYTFSEKGSETEVKVELQVPAEYKDMFDEMWPKALKVLKTLSEN